MPCSVSHICRPFLSVKLRPPKDTLAIPKKAGEYTVHFNLSLHNRQRRVGEEEVGSYLPFCRKHAQVVLRVIPSTTDPDPPTQWFVVQPGLNTAAAPGLFTDPLLSHREFAGKTSFFGTFLQATVMMRVFQIWRAQMRMLYGPILTTIFDT